MHKRPLRFLGGAVSVAMLASTMVSTTHAVEALIPSYFYPSGVDNGWPALTTAASSVAITAILNPDSGPGTAVDSKYTLAVNTLRANGGRVIGYVSTSYGTRPIADVKADILKYRSLYSLDGIFLDEMTNNNSAANLTYYKDVYAYIKSLDANYRVTGNPGTNTQPAYLNGPAADTLVTFESDTGYAASTPSNWTNTYTTRRFSNLAYNIATSAAMVSSVNAAVAKRAGYIYVTDDSGANPWDRLPTYWNDEINAIRAVTPTWNSAASGDWNKAASWTTAAVPNGVGAEAYLFGAIASAQTLYTNTDLTLGTLSFNSANRYVLTGAGSLTLDASVEGALIDVRRGDQTINLPTVVRDAATAYVAQNASLTIADPLTIEAGASLTKTGLGTMTMTSLVTDANATLAVAGGRLAIGGDTKVAALTIHSGATLSLLPDASLTLGGATHDLRAALHNARHDGDWSGSGLTSVEVDARHGIGYISSGDGFQRVHLAMNGDTDLSGRVDLNDLRNLAASYKKATDAIWSAGDFDYDGLVDSSDLALLRANYSGGELQFASDWMLVQSLIPEPGTFIAFGLLAPLLRRRR